MLRRILKQNVNYTGGLIHKFDYVETEDTKA